MNVIVKLILEKTSVPKVLGQLNQFLNMVAEQRPGSSTIRQKCKLEKLLNRI